MNRARVLLVLVVLAVAGCGDAIRIAPRDDAGGGDEPATMTAVVDKVVDGDTAWFVLEDGAREKVRFIGVDTPESTIEHEPYGKEAAAYTASVLTKGRTVALQTDVDQRDRYGRLLAYVWLMRPSTDGEDEATEQMLNARLVREGWATVLTVPPNVAYADLFVALQREARTAGRGLWAPS